MANVIGTDGNDWLIGTSESDTIAGRRGNDTLKGGGGADVLEGHVGIDSAIYADSTVGVGVSLATGRGFGGTAEGDTLYNIENLHGSTFNDTLIGNDGTNDLYGLDGNDVLKGGGGTDGLDGGYGDDILKGGGGADFLAGGAGSDTADYSQSAPTNGWFGVWVDLQMNYGFYGEAGGDTFSSIENVTGSAYDDFIFGTDGANSLVGWDGNDQLTGNGGNDALNGGAGGDRLDGGSGIDIMTGGTGNDGYYVDDAADVLTEHVGEGRDSVQTSVSYALTAGCEVEFFRITDPNGTAGINLSGNEFDNIISGNAGSNTINGGGGVDNMSGGGGNDIYIVDNAGDLVFEYGFAPQGTTFDRVQTSVSYTLWADSAIEVLETTNQAGTAVIDLVGNQFNQTIVGNNGSNTIVGSPAGDDVNGDGVEDYDGLDVMTGDGGGDVFVWTSTNETRLGGQEADVVTDFNRAGGDLLAFNLIDANVAVAGDQAFAFVGIVDVTQGGSFTAPGQIGYFTTGTDTYILLNTEVDAGVDYQDATIRVAGVHTVDASWFVP
jgi:Ca2+-binding RTX toxin-like protein